MNKRYTLKIMIGDEWKYYRSYTIKEHAIDKYNEMKHTFDVALLEDENLIKQCTHGKEF